MLRDLERTNFERYERYAKLCAEEQAWEEYLTEDAEIIITAFGVSARVAKSAIEKERAEGIKVGLIRPQTLYPFPEKAFAKIKDDPKIKKIISVEMNMGQMINDVRLATECKKPVELVNRVGGIIPTPKEVYDYIVKTAKEGK